MLSAKHERFCQAVASGKTLVEAYAHAGYKVKKKVAEASASRLSKRADIAARIQEICAKQGDKAEMTRDELRRYLIEVLQTPIGEINVRHRLCHTYRHTDDGVEVKMPDKLRAAAELIKLCGWAEPEKVQLEAGASLGSLLERIRK